MKYMPMRRKINPEIIDTVCFLIWERRIEPIEIARIERILRAERIPRNTKRGW